MATEDNAKLLILNKAEQVSALQSIGIPAEEDTPLSTLADYAKWAGGLLDICYACAPADGSGIGKGTSSLTYFSPDEYRALPDSESVNHVRIGIRLRAENKQFLISLADIAKDGTPSSSAVYYWASTSGDIANLKNYGLQSKGMFDEFDAEGMSDAICAYYAGIANSYSAAGACRKYKASNVDPVEWSMATVAHLRMIFKYKKEINDFFAQHIPSAVPIKSNIYWAANEYDASYPWNIDMRSGALLHSAGKGYNASYAVRAVSAI